MSPAKQITIGDYTIVEVDDIPVVHRDNGAGKVIDFLHANPGKAFKLFESPDRNRAYAKYSTLRRNAVKRYGNSIVLRVRTHEGVSVVYGTYLPDATIAEWEQTGS